MDADHPAKGVLFARRSTIIAADRWAREIEKEERDSQARGSPHIGPQDRRVLTFLKGLLLEAKEGDLIVLPADGYRREVLIGQLLDEPGNVSHPKATDRDQEYEYVGRRVKWLPSKEKREFNEDVIKSLHSTAAFHLIKKSDRQEIYEVAYRNFTVDNLYVATFNTTKNQFTTSDNAIVSIWFNALAAAYSAAEDDTAAAISKISFSDLGLIRSAEAERGELSIDIASPGSVLLHSAGVFALAAMALFPMMQLNAADIASSPIKVKLHAVGSAKVTCALHVAKAAHGIAQTLSVVRLQQACEIGQRALSEATLHTAARLISGH